MQGHNPVKVYLSILPGCISGVHRDKMSRLSEIVHNDPNGIIALRCAGQTQHKVHGDIFPFPNRNGQGLQISWSTHMICFNSPTSVALHDVLGDVLLHVGPPVQVAKIMIHLVAARMDKQL